MNGNNVDYKTSGLSSNQYKWLYDDGRCKQSNKNFKELTEKDFYPPEDTRLFVSGIEDIPSGDNFADYLDWFYDMYEDELFDA